MVKIFVAGTDTEVGKTFVSCAMLKAFNSLGKTTLGLKPIAAGCERTSDGLRNEDALNLQNNSSIKLPYDIVNPFAMPQPLSPHLAANDLQKPLSVSEIVKAMQPGLTVDSDLTIVEGSGGWYAPLNSLETMAELTKRLQIPVVLVVGIRLGCLNHSLLTQLAIKMTNCKMLGWVANVIDPNMQACQENIDTLQNWLDAPLLATIQHMPNENTLGDLFVDFAKGLYEQTRQEQDNARIC